MKKINDIINIYFKDAYVMKVSDEDYLIKLLDNEKVKNNIIKSFIEAEKISSETINNLFLKNRLFVCDSSFYAQFFTEDSSNSKNLKERMVGFNTEDFISEINLYLLKQNIGGF
jgi:hypothetical protein